MPDSPHIVLRIGVTTDYLRDVITGVVDYSRGSDWVYSEEPWRRKLTGTPFPDRCDGVIVSWQNYEDIEQACRRGLAVVCVTGAKTSEPVPRVIPDNVEIGRRAAEYLLGKGFRTLGYVGEGNVHWSALREEGFRAAARAGGAECFTRTHARKDDLPPLYEWLKSMDGPVGLLGGNDSVAVNCLHLCRDAQLRVPEDVAILGVDDDPLICEFARPTLSSVDPRPRRVGYEAAALLDRLLHGQAAPKGDQLVEPGQVIERGSTDMLAMADRTLAEAIRAVRAGALSGQCLKEILAEIPMSRSSIERGFKDTLGRTPGAELRRVRLASARTLLRETDLPIKRIAGRCGFSTQRHLSDAFVQEFAQRPTDYRASLHQ
jgi:LacI family transcriptional regulator